MRRCLFKLKGASTKILVLDILRKALVVIGCLVFLFSTISPFFLSIGVLSGTSNYYWSYRRDLYGNFGGKYQFWFVNNWEYTGSAKMSLALVSMFIFQVLTLASAIGSFFFNERILSFASVVLCLDVLFLMLYTIGRLYDGEYQQGYYLIFPSLALFTSAFIVNEVTKKQQKSARA